jgi:hypothetical protein
MKKLAVSLLIIGALVIMLAPGNSTSYTALAQDSPPMEARVIAWETIQTVNDGRLITLTAAGAEEEMLNFGGGVFDRQIKRCGHDYWAADGQGVALFTGPTEGEIAIYPIAGGAPIPLGTSHRMACAGPATFQFSPNGQRAAYINWDFYVLDNEYAYGNLMVYDATNGTQLGTFDWTNSFTLYDDGVLMLRLYPDGEGYATEGDLDWWDGTARRTLITLEPVYPPDTEDVDCGIRSSSVARVGDTAYVLMGQRCEQTNQNNWRLISVPMAGGAATEIVFDTPAGGFFSESFTTNLYPTKDGAGFLVTTPSGLRRNTVNLQWVTPEGAITPILQGEHVVVDRFGDRLTESRHNRVSLDGSALAFITTTANDIQALYLLDLTTPGGTPDLVEEEGTDQRIFQYFWASNNTLFYAAGSIESSSLSMVRPGGEAQRLERGRFYRLAVSYAGDKVAGAEFLSNPNRIGDDIYQLRVLNTSGIAFVLRVGEETDNQFIPLAIQ